MSIHARLRACAFGVALSVGGAGVQAGLVEIHTSDSFGETTDWTHTFQLPQFDDMGGTRTLLSVVITLDSTIDASAQTENLESWENSITLTLDATVSLEFLGMPLVAPTGVQKLEVFDAAPFDGVIDFAGVSGGAFDLSGFAADSSSRSAPDDLSPWIGTGMVDIEGFGISRSTATGPGNVLFNFQTSASGLVTIRYEYVPTPGAWTILAASVMLIAPRRRRHAA